MVLKQDRRGLEKKFYEVCSPIIESSKYRLYDLDYLPGSHTLRIFIEDPQTDTAQLEDCVNVDKALTPTLDSLEWAPESLVLEVSSPGIFRALNTREHFQRVVGQKVTLQLNRKLEEVLPEGFSGLSDMPRRLKNERKIVATLIGVEEMGLKIKVEDFDEVSVNFEMIKKANLETDIAV